jgi:hypothetical protein
MEDDLLALRNRLDNRLALASQNILQLQNRLHAASGRRKRQRFESGRLFVEDLVGGVIAAMSDAEPGRVRACVGLGKPGIAGTLRGGNGNGGGRLFFRFLFGHAVE